MGGSKKDENAPIQASRGYGEFTDFGRCDVSCKYEDASSHSTLGTPKLTEQINTSKTLGPRELEMSTKNGGQISQQTLLRGKDTSRIRREAYGVFDGHGGKTASSVCRDTFFNVSSDILSEEPSTQSLERSLLKVFDRMDVACSESADMSGTTATTVYVSYNPLSCKTKITFAWVGDSRGLVIDNCIKAKDAAILMETDDHSLQNEKECDRVKASLGGKSVPLPDIDDLLNKYPHSSSFNSKEGSNKNAPSVPVSPSPVTSPSAASEKSKIVRRMSILASPKGRRKSNSPDISVKAGHEYAKAAALAKAAELEKTTTTNAKFFNPQDDVNKNAVVSSLSRSTSLGVASDDDDTDAVLPISKNQVDVDVRKSAEENNEPNATVPELPQRKASFLGQRVNSSGEPRGPMCVFSGATGSSLAVTRSLGDSDGARSVIPIPEFKSVEIGEFETARIVMCSDGVWDVYTSKDVLKKVNRFTCPKAAAKSLANASKERRTFRGLGQDDITVLVIDVNKPAGGNNGDGGAAGCAGGDGQCSIS